METFTFETEVLYREVYEVEASSREEAARMVNEGDCEPVVAEALDSPDVA